MGMGDTGAALAYGSNAGVYNPAGLVRSNYADISFSQQTLLEDASLSFLGYAQPLDYSGLNELGGVTLFGVYRSVNLGKIDANILNPDGSLSQAKSVTAGQDSSIGIGYAEHFMRSNQGPFGEGMHSIGVMAQSVQSKLVESYAAGAVAVNVGYLGSFERLSVGLSMANLGTKLKYGEVGDPLPVSLRAGLSAPYRVSDFFRVLAAYDLVYEERSAHHRAGVEAGLGQVCFLRGGWRFEQESYRGGPTFGFGLNLGRFFVDYAFGQYGDLQTTHRFLLGFRFSHHPFHFH